MCENGTNKKTKQLDNGNTSKIIKCNVAYNICTYFI